MNTFRRIVAAVDFSPGSAEALATAARIAKAYGAELHIVHGVDSSMVDDLSLATGHEVEKVREDVIGAARAELQRLTRELQVLASRIDVQEGMPAERVVGYVAQHHADLLVVGRTGATGGDHSIGTFAMNCVRKAASHVLIVAPASAKRFSSIAVGVDFSDTSLWAMKWAISVASREEAVLKVVHVFFGPWNRLHYRSPTIEVSYEFQQQYSAKIKQQLHDFAAAPMKDALGVRIEPVLVPDYSSPGFGLVKFLEETKPDLVVVGTHGRRGLTRLVMGSTAERVVHDAPCTVLVIKPDSTVGASLG